MLKDAGPPKESASEIATRKWKNNDLRKRIIEAKRKPKLVDPNKEPEIAETITNEGNLNSPIKRFERQFIKEIRTMMQGHVDKNLALYAVSIERRRRNLLAEKLRRLQAAQQGQGG
jgi:hypothetical protein